MTGTVHREQLASAASHVSHLNCLKSHTHTHTHKILVSFNLNLHRKVHKHSRKLNPKGAQIEVRDIAPHPQTRLLEAQRCSPSRMYTL